MVMRVVPGRAAASSVVILFGYGHPWVSNMTQNPDPGSFKNTSSSGVDGRPKIALRWG